MASLNSTNPHSRNRESSTYENRIYTLSGNEDTPCICGRWKKCVGDAVEDDSKKFLALYLGTAEYIMADIRYVPQPKHEANQRVVLEFFFDGDTSDLPTDQLKNEFVNSLQNRISWTVDEYYRRVLKSSILTKSSMAALRSMERLDDKIIPIGNRLDDSFRDAGCMLKFVAVRVSLSAECARCIGTMVFPEYFDVSVAPGVSRKSDPPLPAWIIWMGVSTVIMGVAMVYAWLQILVSVYDS